VSETRDAIGGCLGAVIVAVVVVALAGVVTFVGWQVGWWFNAQDIARTNHAIQAGYANQSALAQEVGAEFTDITSAQADAQQAPANAAADKAQILSTAAQICGQIPQLTIHYDPTWKTWDRENCTNGTLSATSALRK